MWTCISSNDNCACRPCTYPNGVLVLITAQILFFIAFLMSLFAAGDCKFVSVPEDQVSLQLSEIFRNTNPDADDMDEGKKRGLGLFFFEDAAGECTWDRYHNETTFDAYWDYVGRSDWEDASGAAVSATTLGFCAFVWSLIFACVAHPKIIRFSFAAFVLVVLTILQGVPFLLLRSDFCNEHDCSLGRSANYSIAAVVLFFLAGFLMFFTKDHPGRDQSSIPTYPPTILASTSKDENATHADEHNEDEEAPVVRSTIARVPVGDNKMVDVSLVDSQATTVPAQTY